MSVASKARALLNGNLSHSLPGIMPAPDTQPDLVVSQLSRAFPSGAGEVRVLDGVDLALQRGDALAITGPSGSGKSTLLYLVGLLDSPSSGLLRIDGVDTLVLSRAAQADFRNQKIGFVFQDHHLLPQCDVLENVLIPTLPLGGASGEVTRRAQMLLERVGLGHRLGHRPAQLSGGERQRVAVCRALINDPVLLLADEPTGNLDRQTSEDVGTLLLDVAKEHRAILICVTHSLPLAARFARRMELRDGRLVEVPPGDRA
jgi:lipoprotein-releasing system ATP-binding protein